MGEGGFEGPCWEWPTSLSRHDWSQTRPLKLYRDANRYRPSRETMPPNYATATLLPSH